MAFSKYVITSAGRNLLLSCMASGDFCIEKLVLGSGRYTGLMTEIQDVVMPEAEFSGDALSVACRNGQLEVTARLTNEQLEQGFNWREYGVYATDGARTVLYCYDNAGEEPVPITSAATGAGISNTIKVILNVDSAATVNVNFQPEPDIVLDNEVTAGGENAVTGAAVYAFAGGGIPTPTAESAGMALVVDEDGKYALGEAGISEVSADMVQAGTFAGRVQANETAAAELAAAQVRNVVILDTDPGEGAAVDYPDGTVILVYE